MASLDTLRRTILMSLEKHHALLADVDVLDLATVLAEDVAIHIATDVESTGGRYRSVFVWPPGATVTECEVFRSDGRWLRVGLQDGLWELSSDSWKLGTRPLVWRHSLETPADGGFGARHKGRPGLTVADADTCAACHEARTSCQRLFFLSALGRSGGGKFLIENVLCLRGAHRRAALRWILKTRGL